MSGLAKFFIINFIFVCFYGCTGMVNKPVTPSITSMSFSEIGPNEISLPQRPVKSVLRYKTTSKNPIQSGNIIARVDVHSKDSAANIIKDVICDSPSGEKVTFQPSSTYMILSLTNKSQRIYNLGQTVIQIEDDQGRKYPIPKNIEMLITETEADIKKYYEFYKKGVAYDEINTQYNKIINEINQNNMVVDKHKNVIFGTYKNQYDSYKTSHTINTILEFFNPFMYLALVFTEKWPHEPFDKSLEPDLIWSNHRNILLSNKDDIKRSIIEKQKKLINETLQRINYMCSTCQKKMKEGTEKNKELIFTTGQSTYKTIILPGKTEKIVIPIIGCMPENAPKRLYCKIYDIVTITDDASNPTKRDNLSFTFDKVQQTLTR